MLGISALLFPKLALGMSGFETGVAVMPLIEGDENDTEENPQGRIRRSRYLLLTAALIMSVFLLGSSLTTTILIPPHEFYEGGKANGRALAYLAHHLLGNTFGTIYDISTISILWFAGASAMAGLLNLVPRYLPRYGMAPHWASAIKPLVIFFTLITLYVTLIFKADVDAQAGAYATGVLVLFTSASLAVTLLTFKAKEPVWLYYLMATIIFTYTAIQNMIQRPEGLHIASFFIFTIIAVSIISRSIRSTELRIKKVTFDHLSIKAIEQAAAKGSIRLLAHNTDSETSYRNKEAEARSAHNIEHSEGDFIFLEISLSDTSEFIDNCLEVNCRVVKEQHLGQTFEYYVLTCTALAIPNAIAAILLEIKSMTKVIPNAYFGWTEGHPIACFVKYIFLGEGETATITREILRSKESDPKLRPRIHVA
jgi:FtsH-binding integral membrane protein